MISLSNRRRLILGCIGLLILLLLLGFAFVLSHGTVREDRVDSPEVVATPGLLVYGTVTNRSGAGVAGVNIFRSYASYSGIVIATTDADGDYQSDFYAIPGDEMVTVWAEGLGYEYKPEHYYWRHYYGFEQTNCSFLAHLPNENYLPIITR
jgi:hypothetical protein